jgi:radical SAM superfamily enzyme YgiQ (UPF0313 family)
MFQWMQVHKHPFTFNTQSSIDIADDEALISLMTRTGIYSTFIGIETPDEASLHNCKKIQNQNRDLLNSVKKIQNAGMQVSAGFIVGFDSDTPAVFQKQIDFIDKSGIVAAMVGLLNAPKHTKLYQRLKEEKRLTVEATGSNTDYTMNFIPKMDKAELLNGYERIIQNIYSIKPFYKRIRQSFMNYNSVPSKQLRINFSYIKGLIRSLIIIGIFNKGRREYWKLLLWTLFRRPDLFIDAVTYTIYGFHFRKIYGLTK